MTSFNLDKCFLFNALKSANLIHIAVGTAANPLNKLVIVLGVAAGYIRCHTSRSARTRHRITLNNIILARNFRGNVCF